MAHGASATSDVRPSDRRQCSDRDSYIDAMPGAGGTPRLFGYQARRRRIARYAVAGLEAASACNYIGTSFRCLCAAVVLCRCGATAIYCFSVLVLLF